MFLVLVPKETEPHRSLGFERCQCYFCLTNPLEDPKSWGVKWLSGLSVENQVRREDLIEYHRPVLVTTGHLSLLAWTSLGGAQHIKMGPLGHQPQESTEDVLRSPPRSHAPIPCRWTPIPPPAGLGDSSPLVFQKRLLLDVATSTHCLSAVAVFTRGLCGLPLLILTTPFSTPSLRTSSS